jgi:threonine synthase
MATDLLADLGLSEVARLASIGPDNPARIPLQAAAWIAAAARLGAPGRAVVLAAPAEETSLAASAWAAQRMGLSVQRIALAGGEISPFARMFAEGRFHAAPGAAPPAGLERLYFEAVDREALETTRAMAAVGELGGFDLPPRARAALAGIAGVEIDAVETARSLVQLRNASGEFVSPGTAAAAAAARRVATDAAIPVIVPALAHPGLVGKPVVAALGEAPPAPRRPPGQAADGARIERLPADLFALKAWVRDTAGLSRAA